MQASINKFRRNEKRPIMTGIIKKKTFKQGDLVLVYDSKFIKHPGKFRTHCLGPYEIAYVIEGGVA